MGMGLPFYNDNLSLVCSSFWSLAFSLRLSFKGKKISPVLHSPEGKKGSMLRIYVFLPLIVKLRNRTGD